MTFNVNYSLFIEFYTIFIFKKAKTGCQEYYFRVKAEKAPFKVALFIQTSRARFL